MTCRTALLTVLIEYRRVALVVEGFACELGSERGSGTKSTSRTAAAAADGEGYATEDVVAAAAADCWGCATFNGASTTAAEIKLALPVLLPKG